MALSILYTPEAQQDLKEAVSYFKDFSKSTADKFKTQYDKAIRVIQAHPNLGSSIGKDNQKFVIPKYNYMIIYTIDDNDIIILSVFNTFQDSKKWEDKFR